MKKKSFHGIVRTLLLTVLITLPCIIFTSCSSDDEESYVYNINMSSIVVSGSMSYIPALTEAEKQFDSTFTLIGTQETCDKQAKAKFATAITIIRNAAANVTDCKGYVIYTLNCMEKTIACKKRRRLLQQNRSCCYSSEVAKLMFFS